MGDPERMKERKGPPATLLKLAQPVASVLAGKRWFPLWGVMHHVGRTSGTEYAIPIALIPIRSDEHFLIALPWGAKTNWVRNVQAAGGARVTWKGRDYVTTDPTLLDPAEAADMARTPVDRIVGSGRFPAFLRLSRK